MPLGACNSRVQQSIFRSALGFEIDAEEIKVVNGEIVRVQTKRYIEPSPAAQIFWLKAQCQWTDRPEVQAPAAPHGEEQQGELIEGKSVVITRDTARRLLFAIATAGKAN